jgi:phosphonate transport system permease protein
MVRFRDATKAYPDGTVALRGVSLEVSRGQFCVILGSSGAGKSTLLRSVGGLVTLTSGSVTVGGIPVGPKTLGAVRGQIGMVHQQFGLVGRATVLDNVLGGALRVVPTWRALLGLFPEFYRRRACVLLADVGLTEGQLYRRASELSGGQQQRVAIARAFILEPQVVLADEPVASLDVATGATMLRLLREMSARHGTTVLCCLHQVDLARQFADRIVAMRGGEVIADGVPAQIDDRVIQSIYERVETAVDVPAGRSTGAPAVIASVDEPTTSGGPRPGGGRTAAPPKPPQAWALRDRIETKTIAGVLLALILLAISGRGTEIPGIFVLTAQWAAAGVGLRSESQIGKGLRRFAANALPPVIEEVTLVTRVEGLDRDHLPPFSRIERRVTTTSRYDFDQKKMVEASESQEVLVKPIGYLVYVFGKMLQTLELALWGTLVALALGLPLAYCGARGYAPSRALYVLSRATSAFFRAMPELVSALILTLAFGFGPMAGVIALGLHSAGFFGKFYADDVENADRGPQEALLAAGANRLKVLRYAVLPQVLPQYVAYTQYILERNVRMATVIGVVGAGGIGIELKGRFDMFDFGHVTTILLTIFVTVLGLERLSQHLRARLIKAG